MAPPTNLSLSEDDLQRIINTAVQAATAVYAQQHARIQNPPAGAAKAETPRRPVINTSNTTQEKWSYFLAKWDRYKTMTNLHESQVAAQLLECCEDDLQLALHRSLGQKLNTMSEEELLIQIKNLAVPKRSTLIERNVMRGMIQEENEDIEHYAARLKGQAEMCNYVVTCTKPACNTVISYVDDEIKDQLCKGLYDQEILQNLLSNTNKVITLKETIDFVSAREVGKKCHSQLSNKLSLSKISTYQKSKFPEKQAIAPNVEPNDDSLKCSWCGKTGHGRRSNVSSRKTSCPAYGRKCNICGKLGHFSTVCRMKTKVQPVATIESENEYDSSGAIFLGGIGDTGTAEPGRKISVETSTCEPVRHMEYDKVNGWQERKPKSDPCVKVKARLSRTAYSELQIKCPDFKTATLNCVVDSGARTTVAHVSLLSELGLTRKDLFPVKQRLCGANSSELRIIGGLFLHLSSIPTRDESCSEVLCYVQEDNPGKFYLSRTACEHLGLLPPDFPTP